MYIYIFIYIHKVVFYAYLQDIRQIPIMTNRPIITAISGIMYVWCASLKSSVTKIQNNFLLCLYLHGIMNMMIFYDYRCTY